MKKLLALLVVAAFVLCTNMTYAGDLNASEVVKQAEEATLFGTADDSGKTGELLVKTKLGDYYMITMKSGQYLDCKKIQKEAYVEWGRKYLTK
jgi:hypothetical protein